MAERKYTAADIAQMRQSLNWMIPTGVSYRPHEMAVEIEAKLQTYIVAGVDPEELAEEANRFDG